MDKKQILITIVAFLLSCIILIMGNNPNSLSGMILGINQKENNPKSLYHVYLEGESIGFIKSKEELEDYIDTKQKQIKDKYKVNKVYAPNDLDIIKEITYNEEVSTTGEIYNKIYKSMGTSSFTIDGYEITIKGIEKTTEEGTSLKEDIVFYVLDKEVFTKSVEKTVLSFVDKEKYDLYITDSQKEIEENKTGTKIESLDIENNITIKEGRIPAGENIYQTTEDLTKFLLFGTTKDQETYIVKAGDTIEEIAEANKLSPEEFLVANTNFNTTKDLLYPGQKVNLGLITPQFDLVEVRYVASKKELEIETVYKDDDTKYVGYEKVEQEGQKGLALVKETLKIVNGEIQDTVPISTVELSPSIDKVIVRGTKKYYAPSLGGDIHVPVGVGSWVWPTSTPYTISSRFGWRWGKLHEGIDISGAGYGSPIKAANNGVVVQSGYTSTNGNYIVIKHSNGYYTMYAHMAARNKQVGDVVMSGDKIGTMGRSGFATGVHLHFAIYNGYPYKGGVAMNPLTTIYR